jgi:hypothetical protein
VLERTRAQLAQTERVSPVTAFDGRFSELRREVEAAMQAQIAAERDELLDRIEDEWSGALAGSLPDLCRTMLARAATDAGGSSPPTRARSPARSPSATSSVR